MNQAYDFVWEIQELRFNHAKDFEPATTGSRYSSQFEPAHRLLHVPTPFGRQDPSSSKFEGSSLRAGRSAVSQPLRTDCVHSSYSIVTCIGDHCVMFSPQPKQRHLSFVVTNRQKSKQATTPLRGEIKEQATNPLWGALPHGVLHSHRAAILLIPRRYLAQ